MRCGGLFGWFFDGGWFGGSGASSERGFLLGFFVGRDAEESERSLGKVMRKFGPLLMRSETARVHEVQIRSRTIAPSAARLGRSGIVIRPRPEIRYSE